MSGPLGVILAGGAGRRMGGAKALAELDGLPLLCYPVTALAAILGEVVVAARADTELPGLPPGIAVWHEPDGRRHPLRGVREALRRAGGRDVLVVAGDLPLVTPEALRALRDAGLPGGAAVARADGRLQPLLARYPASALPVLDALAADISATAAIEALDPVVVEVPAACVLNVNTPEDLRRAAALLASRR